MSTALLSRTRLLRASVLEHQPEALVAIVGTAELLSAGQGTTAGALAHQLGVSRSTLWRWVAGWPELAEALEQHWSSPSSVSRAGISAEWKSVRESVRCGQVSADKCPGEGVICTPGAEEGTWDVSEDDRGRVHLRRAGWHG